MKIPGYKPMEANKGDNRDSYYRELTPTAADVIEALAVLPPDTAIETGGDVDGVSSPGGVWYYPHRQEAFIG
jgi:hypothetical protein